MTAWVLARHSQRVREERANAGACGTCLPFGWVLSSEFADSPETIPHTNYRRRTITVREKLIQLGARCHEGVIYDRRGKEVRFYRMREWGTPPHNYQELVEQQRNELAELERHFTVVRVYSTQAPV